MAWEQHCLWGIGTLGCTVGGDLLRSRNLCPSPGTALGSVGRASAMGRRLVLEVLKVLHINHSFAVMAFWSHQNNFSVGLYATITTSGCWCPFIPFSPTVLGRDLFDCHLSLPTSLGT